MIQNLDLGPIVVGLSIDALGCVVVAMLDFVKIKQLINHGLKKKSKNEIVMFEIKETKEQIQLPEIPPRAGKIKRN